MISILNDRINQHLLPKIYSDKDFQYTKQYECYLYDILYHYLFCQSKAKMDEQVPRHDNEFYKISHTYLLHHQLLNCHLFYLHYESYCVSVDVLQVVNQDAKMLMHISLLHDHIWYSLYANNHDTTNHDRQNFFSFEEMQKYLLFVCNENRFLFSYIDYNITL